MFQVPSYNRSIKYTLTEFENDSMQDLMALFIAKTQDEITRSLQSTTKYNYEDTFFNMFYRFINPYINYATLPIDTMIYFQSSSEQSAGTKDAFMGSGKKSCSYGNGFRKANKSTSQKDSPKTVYFEEKYGASIRGEKDQRVFLDEPRIWTKLAVNEYVLPEKWRSIANSGYTDETLMESMPRILYKHLVPLKIRNKVVQKHKHCGNKTIMAITKIGSEEETCSETGSDTGSESASIKKIEIDADMQKILDEEGW